MKISIDNKYDKIIFLVDENTKTKCLPLLRVNKNINIIEIKSGEKYKNINTCIKILTKLEKYNCTRKSLLINLGGGVITDIGGFCASIFKRGIDFINIPTTLLAQVDASIGGKNGIDFNGYKNEIGTFKNPVKVYINYNFLKTLNKEQFLSGYAEIIKHSLISSNDYFEYLKKNQFNKIDFIINKSIKIKKDVVKKDPLEENYRKILNFGHTIGHAIESYYLDNNNKILHGFAVSIGIICESYISYKKVKLSKIKLNEITNFIINIYPYYKIPNINFLLKYLLNDKKNSNNKISCCLLKNIGKPIINNNIEINLIKESFEFYRNVYNKQRK